MRQEQERI